jgi:hypothetical protein
LIHWYRTEMFMLFIYCRDWALKFGVPGRRWLAIVLFFQGVALATSWLVVSPLVRHRTPPVFRPTYIRLCHEYMRGK